MFTAALSGDGVAQEILKSGAQQLATIASAVRKQIFDPGAPACISYVGGVFRSGLLRERYRMLMELEEGNSVVAPAYGPAAGALIEAYWAAGVRIGLKNAPEEK